MADKKQKQLADIRLKKAYSSYYSSVYKFCLSRLKFDRDYVEDCVQEVFIVLYKKYLSGENVEFEQAFLMKTASNLVKKRYNEHMRSETVNLDEVKEISTHSVDVDDRLSFEQYTKMISDALGDTDKDIFILRYVHELKIEEIAKMLDMTVANVSTRLSRMRKKIREVLNEQN